MQLFAWGRMAVDYSRSMSVSQAVQRTFNGEMCGICRMVANAKQQDESRSNTPQGEVKVKPILFFQAVQPVIVSAPEAAPWTPNEMPGLTEDRLAPPVPPPRAQCA